MLVNSGSISSTSLDTLPGNISVSKYSPTSNGNSEPYKIILFPPKNKEFRYDNDSKSFKMHSLNSPPKTSEAGTSETSLNDQISCSENACEQSEMSRVESGLTPLLETCNILNENTTNSNVCSTPKKTFIEQNKVNIKEILKIENVFKKTQLGSKCFLKGCKWSPDGLCLLSNSDDNVLRLFEVSEKVLDSNFSNDLYPVFNVKEGGTIYDYQWYPLMNSSDPVSCVFVSTSKDAPIHLWDAYTGYLRATYQPINQFDEVTYAYSVAFSPDGSKIYSGYKKFIRIFKTCLPGRLSEERPLKIKGNSVFQTNIVSSISINPLMPSLYAVACYDKTIGLYGDLEGDLLFILKGHSGGVTQVKFSMDGRYLFSGGRKDCEILCWDIRNPGKVIYSIMRQVDTQQKIQFDVSPDDTYLVTGTTDCYLKLYNLKKSSKIDNVLHPLKIWRGHKDCVNGSQFHPQLPLIASVSGQRHFQTSSDSDSESEGEEETQKNTSENDFSVENSLKIWSFNEA